MSSVISSCFRRLHLYPQNNLRCVRQRWRLFFNFVFVPSPLLVARVLPIASALRRKSSITLYMLGTSTL